MPKKKDGRGKRYTAAQKARILKAAAEKKLTALQVQKQFGVSAITFYRWRGPVRGKRVVAVAGVLSGIADLREQVRAYLERALAAGRRGGRKPGRPRQAK